MRCYSVETQVGTFCFDSKLGVTNFLIDAKTGRLPINQLDYDDTKYYCGVWIGENPDRAVEEYQRRMNILSYEYSWLNELMK